MIELRLASERGSTKLAWLDSRHSFSFAGFSDPDWNGFQALKALNDVRMAPGSGFPMQRVQDMEILSYMVEGELRSQDSLGHSVVLASGDVERMSAGSGIARAEMNNSKSAPLRFLQLWIQPSCAGLKPGREQMDFSKEERAGKLRLIASGDREEDCLFLRQDVHVYASALSPGDSVKHIISQNRNVWVQIVKGSAKMNGMELEEGDGAAISDEEKTIDLETDCSCELLLLDLC